MSVKLKAGSMELEAAFIEWLRTQGYNPAAGIDPFFNDSEFVRSQLPLIHDSDKAQVFDEARKHLEQRCRDVAFSGQFPVVHDFSDGNHRSFRYTVTLILSDAGAEWSGRIWDEHRNASEINGSHAGPHANYAELARQHIESELTTQGMANRFGMHGASGAAN